MGDRKDVTADTVDENQIHSEEYILQCGQIHFTIWTNTFYNFDKYILQSREKAEKRCHVVEDRKDVTSDAVDEKKRATSCNQRKS